MSNIRLTFPIWRIATMSYQRCWAWAFTLESGLIYFFQIFFKLLKSHIFCILGNSLFYFPKHFYRIKKFVFFIFCLHNILFLVVNDSPSHFLSTHNS